MFDSFTTLRFKTPLNLSVHGKRWRWHCQCDPTSMSWRVHQHPLPLDNPTLVTIARRIVKPSDHAYGRRRRWLCGISRSRAAFAFPACDTSPLATSTCSYSLPLHSLTSPLSSPPATLVAGLHSLHPARSQSVRAVKNWLQNTMLQQNVDGRFHNATHHTRHFQSSLMGRALGTRPSQNCSNSARICASAVANWLPRSRSSAVFRSCRSLRSL